MVTTQNTAQNTGKHPKSSLVSGNITVMGRRTSIRLEPEMWKALRDICTREHCDMHDICSLVYMRKNPDTSLTAAIRVFLMLYYKAAATEDGHRRAGHGDLHKMTQRAGISEDVYDSLKGVETFRKRNAALQSVDPAEYKVKYGVATFGQNSETSRAFAAQEQSDPRAADR